MLVQIGALRQPVIDAGGLRLLLDPLPQPRPDAHQAFVRDVDDRLLGQRHLLRRHEERDAALAIGVDDWADFVRIDFQNLAQSPQPLRAANAAAAGLLDGESLENYAAQIAL